MGHCPPRSLGGILPVRRSSELRSRRPAAGTHRKGGMAALVGISILLGGEDGDTYHVLSVRLIGLPYPGLS